MVLATVLRCHHPQASARQLTSPVRSPNSMTSKAEPMLDPGEMFPEVANQHEFPSVHADMVMDVPWVDAYGCANAATNRGGNVVAALSVCDKIAACTGGKGGSGDGSCT